MDILGPREVRTELEAIAASLSRLRRGFTRRVPTEVGVALPDIERGTEAALAALREGAPEAFSEEASG